MSSARGQWPQVREPASPPHPHRWCPLQGGWCCVNGHLSGQDTQAAEVDIRAVPSEYHPRNEGLMAHRFPFPKSQRPQEMDVVTDRALVTCCQV